MDLSKVKKYLACPSLLLCSTPFYYSLIGAGIILRLKYYLGNRSLGLDESYRALQVINPSWQEVFSFIPFLPGQPESPLMVVAIEKILVMFFGSYEYVLRFFPLLCGLASVFLYFYLLKRYFNVCVIPLALALFVFSGNLIYYSTELKPYATDVLITLLLYLWAFHVYEKKYPPLQVLFLGIVAGVAMWFSHASLFVTAAIGLWLTYHYFKRKDWKGMSTLLFMGMFWLCNFYVLYLLILGDMATNNNLKSMWGNAFPDVPLFSWGFLPWVKDVLLAIFASPMGVYFPAISVPIFILGCIALFKKQRAEFCLLFIPLVLVLLAAIFRKYPFKERMILFLMPAFLIFISQGYEALLQLIKKRRVFVAIGLAAILLFNPLKDSFSLAIRDNELEDNRQVMSYLKQHYQPGDFICLNVSGTLAYWYYGDLLKFNDRLLRTRIVTPRGPLYTSPEIGIFYEEILEANDNPAVEFSFEMVYYAPSGLYQFCRSPREIFLVRDDSSLEFIPPGRVWLVFMHGKQASTRFVIDLFDRNGVREREVAAKGASVFLYALHS